LAANAETAGLVTVIGATDAALTLDVSGYTTESVTVTSGSKADTITLGAGNDSVTSGDGNDVITDSKGGNDTIVAGAGDDTITATAAGDVNIDAGAGDDSIKMDLTEFNSNDTVAGGEHGTAATAGDNLSLTGGTTLGDGAFANVTGVEYLTVTTASNITLGTNAQAAGIANVTVSNTVVLSAADYTSDLSVTVTAGNTGNDITMGAGDDTILMDSGDFDGGAETIDGGDGTDTLNLTGTSSIKDSDFGTTSTAPNVTGVEVLSFTSNINVTLGSIAEAAGINTVNGGTGPGIALTLDASGYTDTGITVTGGTTGDTITTGQGDDTIDGGDGADTIEGGAGEDVLTGGGTNTADVFSYTAKSHFGDTITDFEAGTDKIHFDAETAGLFGSAATHSIVLNGTTTVDQVFLLNNTGKSATITNTAASLLAGTVQSEALTNASQLFTFSGTNTSDFMAQLTGLTGVTAAGTRIAFGFGTNGTDGKLFAARVVNDFTISTISTGEVNIMGTVGTLEGVTGINASDLVLV
jgi:Ca2+-binding RTX toxin-like protein